VVIAIIGILATLVITQVAGAQGRARNAQAKSDITEAGKAVELFKADDNNTTGNVVTASAATRLYDTTGQTTGGNFGTGVTIKNIFSGTTTYSSTTGASRYGASLSKTPSKLHIYTYTAAGTTAGAVDATSYSIWTSVVNGSGVTDTSFCVVNGASVNGTGTGYSGTDTGQATGTNYTAPTGC
jgi:type II secretory pathway pseudopilin PulG